MSLSNTMDKENDHLSILQRKSLNLGSTSEHTVEFQYSVCPFLPHFLPLFLFLPFLPCLLPTHSLFLSKSDISFQLVVFLQQIFNNISLYPGTPWFSVRAWTTAKTKYSAFLKAVFSKQILHLRFYLNHNTISGLACETNLTPNSGAWSNQSLFTFILHTLFWKYLAREQLSFNHLNICRMPTKCQAVGDIGMNRRVTFSLIMEFTF